MDKKVLEEAKAMGILLEKQIFEKINVYDTRGLWQFLEKNLTQQNITRFFIYLIDGTDYHNVSLYCDKTDQELIDEIEETKITIKNNIKKQYYRDMELIRTLANKWENYKPDLE